MHDKNGNPLASGDQVILIGTFEPAGDSETEYCNGNVTIPKLPGTGMSALVTINAKHCEKVFAVSGDSVADSKVLRKKLDAVLQDLKTAISGTRSSEERSEAVKKIKEAIMWLGMDLKAINEESPGSAPNPYPQSYNPASPVVEPTADGLKL